MDISSETKPRPSTVTELARNPRSVAELRAWHGLREEETLEPGLPIIDPHHHLWIRPGHRYLLDEFLEDASSGHNVRATVFVECGAMYKASGPQALRPVGETEFANGMAAMSASGLYGSTAVCAGIVGFADLTLGEAVQDVLEAHIAAGGGRFRGIRNQAARDESLHWDKQNPKDLLLDRRFRAGFATLAPMKLTYDAWQFFTQLGDLIDLARAFPETTIVLNHLGGIVGVGGHEGRLAEEFPFWREHMRKLAEYANVVVKVGGLAMLRAGFDAALRDEPPSSEDLAALWRPYVETCIDAFGPHRCMFESDFPPDKQSCSYRVLWNVFKRLAGSYSADEKSALFHDTAARVYRLLPLA
ncbi:MAG: amidohydrolase family protein [Burkholderiales bacterium]